MIQIQTAVVRPHVALAVRDVDASAAFYERLFGVEPVKRKPGYVKFSLSRPALNLSLNEVGDAAPVATAPEHFGIEVNDEGAVVSETERLRAAGLDVRVEDDVTCCHAVQTKLWVSDPDGRAWEVFVVHRDAEVANEPAAEETPEQPCCGPACCT